MEAGSRGSVLAHGNVCLKQLGADVQLDTRLVPAAIEPKEVAPANLPGVAPQETETLAVRTFRLAQLGRSILENREACLTWVGNEALDGSWEACASVAET